MKKLGIAVVVASGLGAAVIGLAAPAYAAPDGNGGDMDTILQLQAPDSAAPRPGNDAVKNVFSSVTYVATS
jgi:hypothetical protein